ncbi:hypothetical protein BMS3Bbin08_01910 [bacterium BMS3Bbin08]|nr:hypothetical protein BMS3Bbin08_01910 [bacterium BMS3Bbin08]
MEEIWDKWQRHYKNSPEDINRICKDGILNTEEFKSAKPKILFIMKEVNDFAGKDLRVLLKDGPCFKMWHTVARWAAGIWKGFPEYKKVNNSDLMREALSKIATINLKKVSGESSALWSQINAYAHRDRELLREQIRQINPDIIIACGVFEILIWLLDLDVDPNEPYKSPIKDNKRNAYVIPWKHPAGRFNNEKSYNALRNIVESRNVNY